MLTMGLLIMEQESRKQPKLPTQDGSLLFFAGIPGCGMSSLLQTINYITERRKSQKIEKDEAYCTWFPEMMEKSGSETIYSPNDCIIKTMMGDKEEETKNNRISSDRQSHKSAIKIYKRRHGDIFFQQCMTLPRSTWYQKKKGRKCSNKAVLPSTNGTTTTKLAST